MNIHEYQAKSLLQKFGVAVPKGGVAYTPQEAEKAAAAPAGPVYVVKAQIHAGGRGAGKFKDDPAGKGGVRLGEVAGRGRQPMPAKMLGHVLVTKQTGPKGREVKRVYVEEGCDIKRELYLGMLIDRATSRITVMASTEGGMEIEEVAAKHPEKILRVAIDPATRDRRASTRRELAFGLGLEGKQVQAATKFILGMYQRLHRARLLGGRDQPAGRDRRRRGRGARRQDELRRQRALPPPGGRGAARRGRGGPDRARGGQALAQLREARRQYRLHGERRRPRHGDDGHHQALRRRARQLPRRRRRRHARSGSPPPSSSSSATRMSRASWSTSSAASCAAT